MTSTFFDAALLESLSSIDPARRLEGRRNAEISKTPTSRDIELSSSLLYSAQTPSNEHQNRVETDEEPKSKILFELSFAPPARRLSPHNVASYRSEHQSTR